MAERADLHFGHGEVGVGVECFGDGAALLLHNLGEEHDIGEKVPRGMGVERVRLTFANVASLDVVMKALRFLRLDLCRRCGECGDALHQPSRICPACEATWSERVAEDGSLAALDVYIRRRVRECRALAEAIGPAEAV